MLLFFSRLLKEILKFSCALFLLLFLTDSCTFLMENSRKDQYILEKELGKTNCLVESLILLVAFNFAKTLFFIYPSIVIKLFSTSL